MLGTLAAALWFDVVDDLAVGNLMLLRKDSNGRADVATGAITTFF